MKTILLYEQMANQFNCMNVHSGAQYDKFADKYHQARHALFKEYIVKPTFAKMVGNLEGKSVIDFGCGSGDSTRVLKTLCNAGNTLGVDPSKAEIEIACQEENHSPLGITYLVGDLTSSECARFKAFDVATTVFVLNYAATKEELLTMCKNIFDAINPSGRFVAMSPNPEMPIIKSTKYEIIANVELPVREGAVRRVTHYDKDKELYYFDHHHWSEHTYNNSLSTVGFKNIQWIDPIVSEPGLDRFGPDFWKEYLDKPYQLGLICLKT